MAKFTQGQVIITVALAVVILALCGILAAVALSGGVKNAAEVTLLIGLVGTLVSTMLAVLKLGQVSQQINGHIAQHEQDAVQRNQDQMMAQLQPMIDQAVATTLAGQQKMVQQMKDNQRGGDT